MGLSLLYNQQYRSLETHTKERHEMTTSNPFEYQSRSDTPRRFVPLDAGWEEEEEEGESSQLRPTPPPLDWRGKLLRNFRYSEPHDMRPAWRFPAFDGFSAREGGVYLSIHKGNVLHLSAQGCHIAANLTDAAPFVHLYEQDAHGFLSEGMRWYQVGYFFLMALLWGGPQSAWYMIQDLWLMRSVL